MQQQIRFKVFKRDNFRCQYCGRTSDETILEVDHIIPRSKGGNEDFGNLITACRECNRGKTNMEIVSSYELDKNVVSRQLYDNLTRQEDIIAKIQELEKELLNLYFEDKNLRIEAKELENQIVKYKPNYPKSAKISDKDNVVLVIDLDSMKLSHTSF
jgi:CRISPR/Cas system Type II protein with McrA/HNH and RuvC-like nuclease domain